MLPDEVREAVEAMDLRFTSSNEIPVERASIRDHEWAAIKAHLLAREAEVERADGLLRECLGLMEYHSIDQRSWGEKESLGEKITAHLSENSRGND